MNKEILLSIVIPFKNTDRDKFRNLCTSIRNSIHSQDPDTVEIVIVNDRSTEENSVDLFNIFDNEFKCTKFLTNKLNIPEGNVGGIMQSRLYGSLNSKGKYIWSLDSDDELFSNSLDIALKYIKLLDFDIMAWRLPEDKDKNESKYITETTISYEIAGILKKKVAQNAFYKTREISGYVHCKIVKRDIILKSIEELQKFGYINMADDHLLCNYWMKDSDKVLIIPQRLYNYLEPDCSSKVRNTEPKFQLAQLDSVRNVKNRFTEFFNKYSDDLLVDLTNYDKSRMKILCSICRIPSKELCSELMKELIEEFGGKLLVEYSENNNGVFDRFIK